MVRIMSDNDVQGHVKHLVDICQELPWAEFWSGLDCVLYTFKDLGLPESASDAQVWHACQEHEVLLITANRNALRDDSL
jgi:hypothetical protein